MSQSAVQCIYSCSHGQDELLKFTPSSRIGNKGDLSDFECVMAVGLSSLLQKLLIYWDFQEQPCLWFRENDLKKEEHVQ